MNNVIAQLQDKNILVLGAGLTGMSCVRFLVKQQITCTVNDSRENATDANEFQQKYDNCSLVQGHWDFDAIAKAQVIIASPGIDLEREQIAQHISQNCQVIGDVELFCQLNDKPIIAVTGSNGKSTVVSLLAHVANELGIKAALGGNVGIPVLDQLDSDVACFIFELSSFQLETVQSLKAKAATVLNVSDDHLDRHITIENYAALKQKIYQNADVCVVNLEDNLTQIPEGINANKVLSFSKNAARSDFGLLFENNHCYLAHQQQKLIALNELPLAGTHNALNYLSVIALGSVMAWPIDKMVKACAGFKGLAHRCQRIPTTDNIEWVNDSKATNVGATLAAIEGIAENLSNSKLILIAGGDGKGADFSPLKNAFNQYVSQLITLGKDGEKLAALTSNSIDVASIEEAVLQASRCANSGDVVLLSPACASIDMFKNFVERGNKFSHAVLDLQEAS